MIKNIVFDIGRVLLGWNMDLTRYMPEETAAKVEYAIWGSGLWDQMDHGIEEEDVLMERMVALAPEYEGQIRYVLEHLHLIAERWEYAIPWVKELKARGYKVYFLSNYSRRLRRLEPWTIEFTEYMDGGIFSSDVKLMKPDHAIYELLCSKYDLAPAECVFIDDRKENVDAAIACGMEGIVFENQEISKPILEAKLTRTKVFCYGDSNTYGYNPLTGGRWPEGVRWTSLLQEKLGAGFQVVEEGCNGRTTIFPEPGAPWKSGAYGLEVCLNTHKPADIMVLMLGTNDLKDYYHASAAQIAAGAEQLVQTARAFMREKTGRELKIILVSPIEIGAEIINRKFGDHFKEDARPRSLAFAALYQEVAERNECFFVNAAEVAEPSEADCLHMMPEAHAALAESIYQAIRKIL